MPGMLQAVHRFLPRANPDYRNLVEYGIIAGSRKTICWSLNHVNRYANNQITKGTFEKPCMIRQDTLVALDPANMSVKYAVHPADGTDEVALKDSSFDRTRLRQRDFSGVAIESAQLTCARGRERTVSGRRRGRVTREDFVGAPAATSAA